MASTPSINPTQVSARNTEEGARFNEVLFSTLDALEEARIPFALIGGVASGGLGRPRPTHDIDVFVRPEDAEATLRALDTHGFRTDRFDIEWLFKAVKSEILVDVIFRSKGDIYFDEEMQEHSRSVEYHGRKVPVVSPEDLVIIKAAVHYEGGPHHWHDALAVLSHANIDWTYLLRRARRAPRRLLALLIYAQSSDILIPNHVIHHLFDFIFNDSARVSSGRAATRSTTHRPSAEAPRPPSGPAAEYLLAHIRQALSEDGRTAQQDLQVALHANQVVIRGDAPSEASRRAVEEVVHLVAPGLEVLNQVQVAPVSGPEHAEAIS